MRAACYVRFSSDNQRTESIDAQLRAIQDYCTRKGYALVQTYPDEARSATTDNRPNFQRMISDSAKGMFDVVVVHKLDRFARDRYDSAFYKRQLKNNGVRLESVLEQFDNSPESIILESVLEGMAEYYSKNLAREARKGMMENATKGLHTGGRPPYGYKVNPDTMRLEIDEQAARAVRIYFDGIDQGIPTPRIAEMLNEMGYRTQTGRKFTRNSFDGWARNRKYTGVYTWDVSAAKDQDGKRNNHASKPDEAQVIIPDAIPAIIPPDLFERVNQLMDKRKQGPGRMKAKVNYLLTGKIVCGQCGAPYAGNSYRNNKSADKTLLTYYKCQSKCGNTSVRKDEMEAMVIDQLLEVCFSDGMMRDFVERVKVIFTEQQAQNQQDIEPLRKEIAELRRKIDNWIDAIGDGIKGLAGKIKEAEQRVEILETELRQMEAQNAAGGIDDAAIIRVLEKQKRALLSDDADERKRVVQEFIESVTVQPSSGLDEFDAEIAYRVFTGGGEACPVNTLRDTLTVRFDNGIVTRLA